jgi:predicted transcriptional regulator
MKLQHGETNLTSNLPGNVKLNTQELQFAILKHQKEWSSAKGARRGKLDIMAEILLYCEEQKSKTSIMYNANLNYSQLKSQIHALTSQGLLQNKTNKYIITEKGYRFLELFAQLNDLLEEYKSIK